MASLFPLTETPEVQAHRLALSGYRCTSNTYRMVSRIDRPDWIEWMASQHAPWSRVQGLAWVHGLGIGAGDHYRRCYSKDTLTVSDEVYRLIKRHGTGGGWGNLVEYREVVRPGLRLLEV